jgi:type I restriction enzyme M protein
LRNEDLESTDIFGDAFEYLLEQFADETKKSGGNFFTPKEIVRLLVNLVEPKEGMSICDPTCGSGGMLIESMKYISQQGGNPRDLVLEGQDVNYGTVGMCKMNMVLHGIEDFRIEYGDAIVNPKLVEGGKLITYDRVLANFPFSMDWDNKNAARDPYNRFRFGIPPTQDKADFAFIQHRFASLNRNGQAAIICSQGILFRGNEEENIRKNMISEDIIEGIVALPPKLFYGTGIPGCVLILNRDKPAKRKNKIIFIYAARDYEEGKVRNKLREEDIKKIVSSFKDYEDIDKYCHITEFNELKENDYNLNVPRYLDTSDELSVWLLPLPRRALSIILITHLSPSHFPRNIMTYRLGRQILVHSIEEAMRYYEESKFLDCRISAYPPSSLTVGTRYLNYRLMAPNLIMIDIDISRFTTERAYKLAVSKTLKNVEAELER